ncbi:MAG: hypothetical protein ACR2HR_05745 [Euzebya sp.]
MALTPDDIELRVNSHNEAGSFYGFSCPRCDSDVRKPADERVVRLLVSGGVPALPVKTGPVPVRLRDRFDHPALTPDDLLDFHQTLASEHWFDCLLDQVA